MRKDILWARIGILVLVLWISLTTYKLYRRSAVLTVSPLASDPYYKMLPTPDERKQELGRGTWTFLHNVAAKYSAYPTREEQSNALKLVDLITKLFPCPSCREHFAKLVEGFPPKVGSHEEFATWMCEAHNMVNERLGKQAFDCKRLDERWDCGCVPPEAHK